MLEKPEFDCTNLGAFYDCGCAEDDNAEKKGGEDDKSKSADGHSAASRGDGKQDSADLHDHLAVEISKEE
jgi:hypothetical protein